MIATKFLFTLSLFAFIFQVSPSFAGGMDARSQSKISKAMASKWKTEDTGKDGYSVQNEKSFVNIGSRRDGNCNVNIGTVQKGEKAPREIVVTTKEVINVCK